MSVGAIDYYNCELQKIMENIYIGDQEASKNKNLLDSLKIQHIVVVGFELKPEHPKHFTYLEIPVKDNKKENISEYFPKTNEFIENAVKSNQAVLIHCAKGRSRSATIILAFIMYRYKLQFTKALAHVKKKRQEICPNQGFIFQLKKYEKQLQITK